MICLYGEELPDGVKEAKAMVKILYLGDPGSDFYLRFWTFGCGLKLNRQRAACFSAGLYLPGFHFGYPFLTHSHLFPRISYPFYSFCFLGVLFVFHLPGK